MKHKYIAPVAEFFDVIEEGIVATSQDITINDDNIVDDDFEELTQKKHSIWGEDHSNSTSGHSSIWD